MCVWFQIIVWRYPFMSKVATLTGHTYRVLYLAMSPDGQTIVTGNTHRQSQPHPHICLYPSPSASTSLPRHSLAPFLSKHADAFASREIRRLASLPADRLTGYLTDQLAMLCYRCGRRDPSLLERVPWTQEQGWVTVRSFCALSLGHRSKMMRIIGGSLCNCLTSRQCPALGT